MSQFSIDLKFDRLRHHSSRRIRLNACIGNRNENKLLIKLNQSIIEVRI